MRKVLGSLAIAAVFAACGNANAQFAACTMSNRVVSDSGSTDPFNFVRMALRQDGRPFVVYTSAVTNSSAIYFYDCDDADCTTGHAVLLDASTNYLGAPGVAIRDSGFPAIVATYFGGIRFYDCGDAECASGGVNDVRAMQSAIFSDTPVALQANGNPAILYVDGVGARFGQLIINFCVDVACANTGSEAVLATPTTGLNISNLSLAFGSDGLPSATYLLGSTATNLYNYYIAHCADTACTSVTSTQISAPVGGSTPFRTALDIRSDETPIALDSQSSNRALLNCTTESCSTHAVIPLPSNAVGVPIGMKVLSGNRPAFALFGSLSVGAYACADAACSTGGAVQTASATSSISDADFVIDPAFEPAMSYIDAATDGLSIARCLGEEIFADGFDVGTPLP